MENKRLEKEYGRLVKDTPPADPENENPDSLCSNAEEAAGPDGDKESVAGDAPEDKADDKAGDGPARLLTRKKNFCKAGGKGKAGEGVERRQR